MGNLSNMVCFAIKGPSNLNSMGEINSKNALSDAMSGSHWAKRKSTNRGISGTRQRVPEGLGRRAMAHETVGAHLFMPSFQGTLPCPEPRGVDTATYGPMCSSPLTRVDWT